MVSGKKIIVIGGGLAGLISAIMLQNKGFSVTVFEKKKYPFHRVCGEYISNEARPFLQSLGIQLADLEPSCISRLLVTTESGKQLSAPLPLGGFGLSRYKLDERLFQHASQTGVHFIFEKVLDLHYLNDEFVIDAGGGRHFAEIVIASYGKRSNLDQKLNRNFFYNRSPYLGVKYHIKTALPADQIRLDNFQQGYSGVCKIEDDKYNLCYLSKNINLKQYHGIAEMEEHILFKNPFLKHLFANSDFLYNKPEVINEISFEPKKLIEGHVLFCGDSAGMITPLCGNGMAMAIHSAKLLSECIIRFAGSTRIDRSGLERAYSYLWQNEFRLRLNSGRIIQRLFGNRNITDLTISALQIFPALTHNIVKKTHGKVF